MVPRRGLFIGGDDASFVMPMSRAAVTTNEDPPSSIYVANADATVQSFTKFQNPFEQGEIHGMVYLEGQPSSSGAYVGVGNANHFAAAGSSHFLFPGELRADNSISGLRSG